LLRVTLALSIVLALLPLAGIVWISLAGSITSVDGLFMSLILLTISAVFLLNLFWECRARGLFGAHKATTKPSSTSAVD
jgi:uncharacterized membrane protein